MAFMSIFSIICTLSFHLLVTDATDFPQKSDLETYIVHVEPPGAEISTLSVGLERWYLSFLPTTTATSNEESRLVYSYHNVFNGFAARLSVEEVKEMEKKKGFISARPQEIIPLHTTHSPNFLGLNQNMGFWQESNYGKGVIIGVLDTGITPDHPSFSDEGMPPPPAKWKGQCQFSSTTSCNNKLIGARYFQSSNGSPLDGDGHGTHTAGTAAGNYVAGASVYGNANGTAAGIAPLAHLAIYKVCDNDGRCSESDILMAMDTAIDDGVDVLSLSLGGGSVPFYKNNLAIGAFSAMEKGIFVSCSAGNNGPFYITVSNDAPWILTVGASTTDRRIKATAVLGNNEKFEGESAFQPMDFPSTLLPLIFPGLGQNDSDTTYCTSLNNIDVKGKVVVCLDGEVSGLTKGQIVKAAGGAAMIIINPEAVGYTISADAHVLPATHLSYADGLKLIDYIRATNTPTATILFSGTTIGDGRAPTVGYFSSRGPSIQNIGILKPDITGPGVNILAAWHRSVENKMNSKSNFNILSGTSMSCPHLSGVAALLKSAHPEWSPAAIKSAIITTADLLNLEKKPIEEQRQLPADIFAIGGGHVNPSRANNPGLIYDIEPEDYTPYLCGLGYTDQQVGIILRRQVTCSAESSIPDSQLNYPSFSFVIGSTTQTYTRTVTNVGDATATYSVEVDQLPGVNVTVKPTTLSFSELNQKMKYEVTFSRLANVGNANFVQGSLTWTSDKHSVRSPVVAILNDPRLRS